MAAEEFFKRWSKPDAPAPLADSTASPPTVPPPDEIKTFPTLDDVACLNKQADYKPFLAKGIDEGVKRSALKKLFSDPHFNVMDGLDTYIGDYNKFEPIPPEMLAMLNHAKALLNPLAQFEKPLQELLALDPVPEPEADAAAAETTEVEAALLPADEAQSDPQIQAVIPLSAGHASIPTDPSQGPA